MITVPFTFVATVSAICYTGATPVFVDIDPRSFTMDPAQLEQAITPRTKAILPVHLYGQMADMDADPRRSPAATALPVIEDACQAHGAEYKGSRAGSIGDCRAASASIRARTSAPTAKAASSSPATTRRRKKMRMLRDWGQEKRYHHVLKGFNYRMDGIQGAILGSSCATSRRGPKRAARARATTTRCSPDSGTSQAPEQLPAAGTSITSTPCAPPIATACSELLQAEGVQTGLHYPIPVHLQQAHADLGYKAGRFPGVGSARPTRCCRCRCSPR